MTMIAFKFFTFLHFVNDVDHINAKCRKHSFFTFRVDDQRKMYFIFYFFFFFTFCNVVASAKCNHKNIENVVCFFAL